MRRATAELDASTSACRQQRRRRRCILMGHSMGCITAATAALDPSLPPRHTALVLVAPALSLHSSSKKLTAEQQRASARRKAAAAAAAAAAVPQASSEDGFLRGGGGGRRGAGSSSTSSGSGIEGGGGGGVVGAMVGAPVSAANAVLHAGVWLFNWCLLPMIYPLEILGLR